MKRILTYAGILLGFVLLAYGFVPEVLTGKIVDQDDIAGYLGMSREVSQWNSAHPEDPSAWTGSMFGGMPTTMLTGNNRGDLTEPIYKAFLAGPRPASYLLISLVGAFLMLLALGIHPLLAAGGAVAVTFCSYNFQIIQVGHNAKMLSLAWAPWVIAAAVLTYRSALGEFRKAGKPLHLTLLGAALFGMALNFQIKANHVQISYYLAIILLTYVLVLAVWVLRGHRELLLRFAGASALLLVLGLAGIAANANRLLPTYLYTQETMRGGSQLSSESGEKSKGLDLQYATAWSYGPQELPNLMIPDFNGGSSEGELSMKSETISLLREAGQPNLRQVARQMPLYWGPQPYTAGPMYMGAITVFLFVLGLCLYRGKEKWWLLVPTLVGIGLALGYHLMWFTKFWYYHVPFYSKFRTVSMALVILQLTLPALGFLVLDRILREGCSRRDFLRSGVLSLALTGGFCLLMALVPSLAGTFSGAADASLPEELLPALAHDRMVLLRSDALVSGLLIVLTFALLLWSFPKGETAFPGRRAAAGAGICIMVLLNMFITGKRYLNSSHFVSPRQFQSQFAKRPVDELILEDPDPDYRVLDLTVNVFNDAHPSYWHKNVGGYSPVKLQRYQDLIEQYLAGEINSVYRSLKGVRTVAEAEAALGPLPVLSLLNSKYIIVDGEAAPLRNSAAMGPVWLVDSAIVLSSPAEELAVLGGAPLADAAVLGPDFASVEIPAPVSDSDGIRLESYSPSTLVYSYDIASPRAAVFSEVYYPRGWKASLEDGTPVELFRADWTLRGAMLPAGRHTLTLHFAPDSYRLGRSISLAASALLLLGLILSLILSLKKLF